jgi:hypothetical protein
MGAVMEAMFVPGAVESPGTSRGHGAQHRLFDAPGPVRRHTRRHRPWPTGSPRDPARAWAPRDRRSAAGITRDAGHDRPGAARITPGAASRCFAMDAARSCESRINYYHRPPSTEIDGALSSSALGRRQTPTRTGSGVIAAAPGPEGAEWSSALERATHSETVESFEAGPKFHVKHEGRYGRGGFT